MNWETVWQLSSPIELLFLAAIGGIFLYLVVCLGIDLLRYLWRK